MIPWLKSQLAKIRRRPNVLLYVMRLADMYRVHPQQITAACSFCGHEVGVYPSGQQVMRTYANVKLICQVCGTPGERSVLAPGALQDAAESMRKQ